MALHQTAISAPSIHEIAIEGYRAAVLTTGAWYVALGSMLCAATLLGILENGEGGTKHQTPNTGCTYTINATRMIGILLTAGAAVWQFGASTGEAVLNCLKSNYSDRNLEILDCVKLFKEQLL